MDALTTTGEDGRKIAEPVNPDALRKEADDAWERGDFERAYRLAKRAKRVERRARKGVCKSAVDVDVLRRMLAENKTCSHAARHFGVSRERVRQICVKHGLTSNVTAVIAAERRNKIAAMLAEGMTQKQIVSALRASTSEVGAIASEIGIGTRWVRWHIFLDENASALDAIRNGASIRSQGNTQAHVAKLEYACKKLGIASRHGRWPQNKAARAQDTLHSPSSRG